MSKVVCEAGRMMKKENNSSGKAEGKNDPPPKNTTPKRIRVALEPELEEIAAFWPPAKRFEMARKFRRWARQLKVSGFILFQDAHPAGRPALRYVALRKARLN